jgi:hypothetical protein
MSAKGHCLIGEAKCVRWQSRTPAGPHKVYLLACSSSSRPDPWRLAETSASTGIPLSNVQSLYIMEPKLSLCTRLARQTHGCEGLPGVYSTIWCLCHKTNKLKKKKQERRWACLHRLKKRGSLRGRRGRVGWAISFHPPRCHVA